MENDRALGQYGELVERNTFHGGETPQLGRAALADVARSTTPPLVSDPDLNSVLNSHAEGVATGSDPGLGRVAASSHVPAQGAGDHGTTADVEECSRRDQGSRSELKKAAQNKVSPSSFRQVMSVARTKLHEIGTERMQHMVEALRSFQSLGGSFGARDEM